LFSKSSAFNRWTVDYDSVHSGTGDIITHDV
jgi:hypothetical protein